MKKDMLNGRLAEWLTSAVMVMFAVALALPGDSVLSGFTFRFFFELGLNETVLAVPTALIGAARLMALYINGTWRRTPSIRMAGALLGAGFYGFLSMSFLWPYAAGLTPAISTAATTYGVLAIFDVIAAYRSANDARIVRT